MNFDKFKGIRKERDIKEREKNSLEKLIEICDEVLNKYGENEDAISALPERSEKIYLKIYDIIESKQIEFGEDDLRNLILAKANMGDHDLEKSILGMYTGCLLQKLTENNKKEGKPTRFYINGHGNSFPYLFHFGKKFGEVIVENFLGNKICGKVGFNGKANKVIGVGIKGNGTLETVNADVVVGIRIEGNYALFKANAEKYVLGIEIKGDNALSEAKSTGQIIGAEIEGKSALQMANSFSSDIDQIIGMNITGNFAFSEGMTQCGFVRQVLGLEIKGEYLFDGSGKHAEIETVILEKITEEIRINAKNIILKENAFAKYPELLKQIELIKSMKGKNYQEIIQIADQLYELRPKRIRKQIILPQAPDLTEIFKAKGEGNDTNLKNLIHLEKQILAQYKESNLSLPEKTATIYQKICDQIKETNFNEKDLEDFIFTEANKTYEKEEAEILGLYTGCLLQILTERNEKQGKRTRFYIDGKGKKFDYLFYCAKTVDELIIDNFTGNMLGSHIGSYGGKANSVILVNNKGNGVGRGIASNKGKVGLVIVANNEGKGTGANIGAKQCDVDLVIIAHNKGLMTAHDLGYERGNIGTVVIADNKGGFCGNGLGRYIEKLIISNNITSSEFAEEIITGKEATEEYEKLIKKYKINEILEKTQNI